jgi:hypothetical protein
LRVPQVEILLHAQPQRRALAFITDWNIEPKMAGLMRLQSSAQACSNNVRIFASNAASGSCSANRRPLT